MLLNAFLDLGIGPVLLICAVIVLIGVGISFAISAIRKAGKSNKKK